MNAFKNWGLETSSAAGIFALALTLAGCGTAAEGSESGDTTATTREALVWNPNASPPGTQLVARYSAENTANNVQLDSNGLVHTWVDLNGISGAGGVGGGGGGVGGVGGHNVTNMGQGKPSYSATGWDGTRPALSFAANSLLRNTNWTGVFDGEDQAFSVLAIARSTGTVQSSLVGFWASGGIDAVRCQFTPNSGNYFLQLGRADWNWGVQTFRDSMSPVGNGSTDNHALGWLYTPEVMRTFVDGTTDASSSLTSIGGIGTDILLIGARTDLPNELFTGSVAEVYLYKGNLSEDDLLAFHAYAQNHWGI